MSEHTPGPWRLGGDTEGGILGSIYCNNVFRRRVAIVYGKEFPYSAFSRAEEEANARLIAIAPDMYPITQVVAALHVADDARDDAPVFGINGNYITVGDVRRARAAIAKAEGR